MTNSFTYDAQQLATRAYRRLGILPAGGVPSDDQFEQFRLVYNTMALGTQADAPNLFRLTQLSLTIPANVGYPGTPFVFPNIILGLSDPRLVVTPSPNLYERLLAVYPYSLYMTLPNKLQQGSPSLVTIDKQVTQTNLYIWPLPTFGATVNTTVARQVNSIAQPTDPLDFPPEWWNGLSWFMADLLADDEGIAAADPATMQRIKEHSLAFLAVLENFDRPTSVVMKPWGAAGTRRTWR